MLPFFSPKAPGGRGRLLPTALEPSPELSTYFHRSFGRVPSESPFSKATGKLRDQIQAATKREAGKGLGPPPSPRQHGEPYLRPPPPGSSHLGNVRCRQDGTSDQGWTPAPLSRAGLRRAANGLPHQPQGPRGSTRGRGRRLSGPRRLSPEILGDSGTDPRDVGDASGSTRFPGPARSAGGRARSHLTPVT